MSRLLPIVVLLMFAGGICLAAPAKKAPSSPTAVTPVKLHVIVGCPACATLMTWLKAGGIKLDVTNVDQSSYKLFPTVVYSDGGTDNGDRLYKQLVEFPKSLPVISCGAESR